MSALRGVSNIRAQVDAIPKHVRWMFLVLNGGFIVFFSTLLILQIVQMPSEKACDSVYSSEVWNGVVYVCRFVKTHFKVDATVRSSNIQLLQDGVSGIVWKHVVSSHTWCTRATSNGYRRRLAMIISDW